MRHIAVALGLLVALTAPAAWAAIGATDAPVSQPAERPTGAQPSRGELQARAEAGDAEAQYRLGLDYQLGLGGSRDLGAARAWFGRAAAQDHAKGLGGLAYLLLLGQGGPVDEAGAEKALRRATVLKLPSAMANLAELLLMRDPASAEARSLLRQAVQLGALNARYRLGRLTLADGAVDEGVAMVGLAADRGHPEAAVYMAYLLTEAPFKVKRDPARAVAYLRSAANDDFPMAANDLGRFHDLGIGMPADPAQAAHWYRRAITLGYLPAHYNLGLLLANGRLGAPDLPAARAAYKLAAEAGFAPAQGRYGQMLRDGRGGPVDLAKGTEILRRGAEGGDGDAQNHLALAYFNGEGLPRDAAKAMDWWERGVAQNHPPSINNFTNYLATGQGRPADPARAVLLLAQAAERGSSRSAFRLALWHEAGYVGLPKDTVKAAAWFKRAAEAGSSRGMFKYAAYLEAGEGGVKADPAGALVWYRRAAELGNAEALFLLARYSFNGDGVPVDPKAALVLLDRAARRGQTEALFVLGDFYFRGEGLPADPVLAWVHWAVAERLGFADAGRNRRMIEPQVSAPEGRARAQAAASKLWAEVVAAQADDD